MPFSLFVGRNYVSEEWVLNVSCVSERETLTVLDSHSKLLHKCKLVTFATCCQPNRDYIVINVHPVPTVLNPAELRKRLWNESERWPESRFQIWIYQYLNHFYHCFQFKLAISVQTAQSKIKTLKKQDFNMISFISGGKKSISNYINVVKLVQKCL